MAASAAVTQKEDVMAYYGWTQSNPFQELLRLQQEMSRLFGESGHAPSRAFPATNLYDDGENFMLRSELPGLDKDKLDITVAGDVLSIKGSRVDDKHEGSYHRRERGWEDFHRSVTLPDTIDVEKVHAAYQDGVLEVTLPRAPDARPRKVSISS